ncbi:6369_t:CDS:2 [Entrophospora sp. SA101]|nr:6369_t:CDS:2 [Entrophospora sp. SA101]
MAEANQSIFSNRHIMVTQCATDLELIQNGDNAKVFGFDIKPLHDACLQVDFSFLNNNNKTKRKKPLDEITSNSQQNKQFNSFGKDAYDNINKIITKHRLTNSINQQIVYVCNIELEYNGNQVFIKFNPTTNQARLDAVVCACDKALLDHDGYLNLAAVVPNIYHEYLVAERRNEINEIINSQIHIKTFNTNNESSEQYTEDDFDKINSNILVEDVEVGNGVFCSISTLLKVLIPFWKSGEKPVITVGDTLRIKLGKKNPSLFTSIELLNYVPDELQLKKKIEKKMSHINVHFEFYHSNNNRSASWTWTSLMGPEKKKILQSFPMSEFVTGSHGIAIENLWYQFFNLYEMLRKPSYNEEDIIKFELEAKNWVKLFFGGTTMRGGNKTKSVVYDMMVFENRQIFYLLNKVPKEITLHKGKHGKVSLCCDFVMVDG